MAILAAVVVLTRPAPSPVVEFETGGEAIAKQYAQGGTVVVRTPIGGDREIQTQPFAGPMADLATRRASKYVAAWERNVAEVRERDDRDSFAFFKAETDALYKLALYKARREVLDEGSAFEVPVGRPPKAPPGWYYSADPRRVGNRSEGWVIYPIDLERFGLVRDLAKQKSEIAEFEILEHVRAWNERSYEARRVAAEQAEAATVRIAELNKLHAEELDEDRRKLLRDEVAELRKRQAPFGLRIEERSFLLVPPKLGRGK